jgi:diguanylate cyclase (GGDEF)-like protein
MSNDTTMQSPLPENEAQRLQAVLSYDILDTPPEVEFDALTRVAAHAFNTPAAVVGLMDSDRLWFKSRLGLEVQQLDRQIAFCAYAIMRPDEPLVVEDLRQDDRFRENPLVVNPPSLRFYAGVPLIDRHGYALGTIAVADNQPRVFSEAQCAALRDLATLVITALESRHRAIQLARAAMTDHLTGLANRVQFERTLESSVAHARRTGDGFTVLYMDLDGFKAVNDTFGHAAGDEVLCEVAHRLTKQVRAEDLLARIGGDEFGLFMRQSAQDSDSLAKRMVEAVSAPIALSTGDIVHVGISVGMAPYTDTIDSKAALLTKADRALYEAKRQKTGARD